ncbi:MAG: hypothetical protein OMM_00671 [Candidatus Magnetoglobus multicellularis str. Araruama]|uniref:Uncharacterized protein n=1 Tax=Candidatus Magnetoglobus multicellularis str. Araruama TaxID=890399 RepID=A0A1V1PFX6_9BACT|nr:MAG: hypothetical protein OMM_00671 [Candidatus Magnetoglobus multicellularis str. Araruama]
MRINRAYGAFVTRLMDQMATSEIVPDVIQESRINRLKKSDPDMYYALVVFCFSRLPFDVSSEIQLEAHKRCIHNTSDIGFKVFHYEQMAWHQGCLNELHESIICFEKALTIRKKQNKPSRQAWILSQMGWCYQLQKDYDKSFEMHEQACHLYTEDDPINYAWNIGCIGRIHGKCGRFEAAIARHEEAIGILVNNPDIKLSAWNWSRIARNQTRLKRYDLAMNAHQTALKLLEKQMDKELQAWNLEGLAWIYGKVNQYDDAIKVQQQALQYRSQEGNISQQAWNLEGIGWSLGKLERFEEALKVLNRALKVRKNFNHIKGQAWNLEGIARFLGNLGRHDEAIAAHERALVFQEKENNHERQIWNYRGIAWNYKEKNDHDNAIMALNQALNHAKQSESIYWQATLWALIGWNLRQMHRLSDAIKAHEQAIKLYQRQNNTAGILENAGQMAINCFILGQTGRAWNILDHYGASMKCPQKLLSSMGDTIVYLKKMFDNQWLLKLL